MVSVGVVKLGSVTHHRSTQTIKQSNARRPFANEVAKGSRTKGACSPLAPRAVLTETLARGVAHLGSTSARQNMMVGEACSAARVWRKCGFLRYPLRVSVQQAYLQLVPW